ncbi:ABC transporter ATPase [Actinobacillus vicugnae]|uniref:ABC transporter ATPase n=1 Tax=Actinobacillus vicugnae TaxID=2573093 RepID=UPI0012427650|nr:ABC transporter ATPase [Actinobacillus vicugnae]
MRWLSLAISSFFLTACHLTSIQFDVPEAVEFQGKSYIKVTDNRIDEMRQLLYLPTESEQNPENWTKGILFFLDQNSQGKTLQQRVTLRRAAFGTQSKIQSNVKIEQQELRSEVIYPPTERFNDVLLEVSRGRDLPCGYGQIQISDKRSVLAKKWQNSTAYQASLIQLAQQLAAMPWLISCK